MIKEQTQTFEKWKCLRCLDKFEIPMAIDESRLKCPKCNSSTLTYIGQDTRLINKD